MLRITYYTDPLCCWSWAMERGWTQFLDKWGEVIDVNYKLTGVILTGHHLPSWIYTTQDLYGQGSLEESLCLQNGFPVWLKKVPSSSIPACIAVKCVEMQSRELAAIYLRLFREALMLKHLDISDLAVILRLAADLSHAFPSFDPLRFQTDLCSQQAVAAFEKDLDDIAFAGLSCLPTIVMAATQAATIKLCGLTSFQKMDNAITQLLPMVDKDY